LDKPTLNRYAARVAVAFSPMPQIRVAETFDRPELVFEPQHDGFRALARG
jgi:hypothetical protein